ncbi:MAG TPA: tetratricopeptide repeat protein [Verrucomicrobiae bacterium]
MFRPRLIALLLALGTLVVFLPAGRFGFVNYDDPDYVTENNFVKNGLNWTDIRWAFSTFHASNWHPLTWLSLMTDGTLFGLNAGVMHLVNVLFHAVNAALLFILLSRLTQKTWPSAFVAALFAWHPLHVESVAWISEHKDVLSTFFALLSLLGYAEFVMENRRRGWWLALFFFALALLAKPMVVTLPFVLLLLDFWPLNRVASSKLKVESPAFRSLQPSAFGPLLFEKTPFFLLSVAASIVTCLAQRGAMASLEKVALPLRLENLPVAYAGYLLKIFWPVNLAFFYPLTAPAFSTIAAAMVFLLAISIFCWRTRRLFPYVTVGWLWFLGTLVPVIGIVQVGEQAMADRYSYFPAIGIFIIVAFGVRDMAARFPSAKPALAAAAILILAGCVLATGNQLSYWKTDETLFAHAVDVTKNNEIAHINLGVVYEKQGRGAEAMNEYQQALEINPHRANNYNNIGDLLDKAGEPAKALAEYQTALQLNPDAVEVHLNLGGVLVELKQFDEAAKHLRLAAKLKPDDARPHFEMAKALLKQGRDAGAVDEFQQALRLDPDNVRILAFTARVLAADENAALRDGRTALVLATRANTLSDNSQPAAIDALGMACAETGDYANAQICAQKVLDLASAMQIKDTGPMRTRLELYQEHKPWRESFLATNAPPKD